LEAGATRNFEAARTAEKMAVQEQKEKEAEEANNPMKVKASNIASVYWRKDSHYNGFNEKCSWASVSV